jgi:hypothetical protein
MDERADLSHESINDLIHAANRLEKRRLPFVFERLVKPVTPVFRPEQFAQVERGSWFARVFNRDSQPSRVEPE